MTHAFPAKVLLFGEHTILRGSRALAAPYFELGGSWAWSGSAQQQQRLPDFARHLSEIWPESLFNASAFAHDLAQGLYFQADIPTGYGLGSSGAVCAAVFDRYASPEAKFLPPAALKAALAQAESFFHGASSGVDPLLCYLRRPLCLLPDGDFHPVELPPLPQGRFFLLDTGLARSTGPLVQYFTRRFDAEPAFRAQVQTHWMTPTETAINALLAADEAALFAAFAAISHFQRQALPPMIPAALHPVWDAALQPSSPCLLKLCGAGGGGFMLGLSQNAPQTESLLHPWPLRWL
jgi:mevalonate kinase